MLNHQISSYCCVASTKVNLEDKVVVGDDGYFSTVKGTTPSRVMKNKVLSSLEKNHPFPSTAKGHFYHQYSESINLGVIAPGGKEASSLGSSRVSDHGQMALNRESTGG